MDTPKIGFYALSVPVMLTFPNLFEAKAVGGKGKAKFSANFEFETDNPDLAALKLTAAKVAQAKWPGRELAGLKFPFTLGAKLADRAKEKGKNREFSRDKVVMTARTTFAPKLSAIVGGQLVKFTADTRASAMDKFYSGAKVIAQVTFEAYDGVDPNPDGVTAYLDMVCALGGGDRVMGGGRSEEDVFKSYLGTMSNVDPTGGLGLDEEIPF